jgi:Fe-S-cluster containining protein
MAALAPATAMEGDERMMTRGIIQCHSQMNTLAQHIFDTSAQLGALAGALQARGLLSEEEVAEQREREEKRLRVLFEEQGVGVQIDLRPLDKYDLPPEAYPVIDCETRYELCHAACCALRFALSPQDLEEGVVRWDLGEPYRNRIGPDAHCVHIDRTTYRCTVYAQRPVVCRTYDCRQDKRIWLDFEERIINPKLYTVGPDGRGQFHFLKPDEDAGEAPAAEQPMEAAQP